MNIIQLPRRIPFYTGQCMIHNYTIVLVSQETAQLSKFLDWIVSIINISEKFHRMGRKVY